VNLKYGRLNRAVGTTSNTVIICFLYLTVYIKLASVLYTSILIQYLHHGTNSTYVK